MIEFAGNSWGLTEFDVSNDFLVNLLVCRYLNYSASFFFSIIDGMCPPLFAFFKNIYHLLFLKLCGSTCTLNCVRGRLFLKHKKK